VLTARVDLPGWISHDDLPGYLNQLRLLVLPSYTEGLPNIMLEAMACGTPVLATPVGAIPDVIIDGKTGFIMENNSPECIAENVIRALNSPDLERIAENGRRFVEENFRSKRRWRTGRAFFRILSKFLFISARFLRQRIFVSCSGGNRSYNVSGGCRGCPKIIRLLR
jgi:glycosyltransferase involved in cell wall biosynthesis